MPHTLRMRTRVRLPETWRAALSGFTLLGLIITLGGFASAASYLGDTSYSPRDMRLSLTLGALGLSVLGPALALWWAERRGRLVFLSAAQEAELMSDRRLRPPGGERGEEPLRATPAGLLAKPAPLRGAAKALLLGAAGSWVGCVGGLAAGISGAWPVWTGMGGLVLCAAGLAAALAGELLRAARVLRADAEE